jgi:hypothetical protein
MLHARHALLEHRQSLLDRTTWTLRAFGNFLAVLLLADRLLSNFFGLGFFDFLVLGVFVLLDLVFFKLFLLGVFVFFELVFFKFFVLRVFVLLVLIFLELLVLVVSLKSLNSLFSIFSIFSILNSLISLNSIFLSVVFAGSEVAASGAPDVPRVSDISRSLPSQTRARCANHACVGWRSNSWLTL